MIRIDKNTIQMQGDEKAADTLFNAALDRGKSIREAVVEVLYKYPDLDPKFVAWLSE